MSEAPRRAGGQYVDWNDDLDAVIRQKWHAMSARAIGEQLGISKGAVLGRADRLGLGKKTVIIGGKAFAPSRRPEIRPRGASPAPRKSHAERAAITAANKLKAATGIAAAPCPQRRQQSTGLLIGPTLPAGAAASPPAPPPVAYRPRPQSECCWPMWGDHERAPRPPIFCGQPCAADRVYCLGHCRVAYVPSKPREIADAA